VKDVKVRKTAAAILLEQGNSIVSMKVSRLTKLK
jgi:hypothetical protein